ncbi:MAG: hypothetical protein ACJ8BF_06295 [Gemmatimonadales bacterium]
MEVRSWALAIALAAFACAPQRDRPDKELLQQGRMYTAWLYGNEYSKLWDRFSPEMRQTFGSVGELASFASRAVRHLGAESGKVDESVEDADPYRVYTRSASFNKSTHRMLIEWSLAKDGAVTGFVVRPALADSTNQ